MTAYDEDLDRDEAALLAELEHYAFGLDHTRTAAQIAGSMGVRTGKRWSWRRVMKLKAHLREEHGIEIYGWKGGGGHAPGLFLPANDKERRMALAQEGRTLASHEGSHREGERSVVWERPRTKSGQTLLIQD